MPQTAPSLRRRNRLATMRLVQETSVTLMEDRGFDTTTIEKIAETSGVSASTIYRLFGTKENVVLWDERDDVIDAELGNRLRHDPPMKAFRDAVVSGLAEREDRGLFLRRLTLVYSAPSIWAAAAHHDRIARGELAAAIAATAGRTQANMTDMIIAAACLAALDVALDEWQAHFGGQQLGDLIDQAIGAIASLA